MRNPSWGPAGQLLNKILLTMGLPRENTYISNIVKFRPMIGDGSRQGTGNRKPTPREMESCMPFLRAEIEVVQPKVIVALGGTAIEGLLGEPVTVGRARNQQHTFEGIPMVATYHPSYLLRNQALSERRKVWEDMLKAMEILGMEITERHRTFFAKG